MIGAVWDQNKMKIKIKAIRDHAMLAKG